MAKAIRGLVTLEGKRGDFLHYSYVGPMNNRPRKRRAEARRKVLSERRYIEILERLSAPGAEFYSYTTLYKDEGYWPGTGKESPGDYDKVNTLLKAGYVDLFDDGHSDGWYRINDEGRAWLASMKAAVTA